MLVDRLATATAALLPFASLFPSNPPNVSALRGAGDVSACVNVNITGAVEVGGGERTAGLMAILSQEVDIELHCRLVLCDG